MRAAQIDPKGMVTMFEKFAELDGDAAETLGYLSTHPATKDRIARLKKLIAEAPGETRPIEIDVHWARVKAPCKVGF